VKYIGLVLLLAAACAPTPEPEPPAPVMDLDRLTAAAERIAETSGRERQLPYRRLRELAGRNPRRITGSVELERAIEWAASTMRDDGLDDVRLEPASVPHWVRGTERAAIVQPIDRPFTVLALGGSVGTPGTVRASVVAFDDMDALRGTQATLDRKIVFVNHRLPPFDEAHDDPGYRTGVQARLHAASEAAKRGALAVLVRSVTAVRSRLPHAGALAYEDGAPRIPAAAVSTMDADMLADLVRRGPVTVELELGARTLPDVPSANVVGEIRGSAKPDEIVLLGAHIDSWDVGPGASDDAAGCVAVMEAMRLLRDGGLDVRRTVRAVLFTGEEYLLAGSRAYAATHGGERHVAAFETDYGMGAPDAIGVGSDERRDALAQFLPAFTRFGIRRFQPRAFGADVKPLVDAGAQGFDLEPDGRRYFDVHHSAADDLKTVRPEDLRRNSAAIALLAYYLANR
jgi:hypothetical protein